MTRYVPAIHDATVRHLFQCKMTDEQIAERLDVGWQTIRRARQRLGLGLPPAKEVNTYIAKPDSEQRPAHGPEPTSPVQIAKLTLGDRITERNGVYILDRTPISAADMVREANRVRVSRRRTQFGPSELRVKP